MKNSVYENPVYGWTVVTNCGYSFAALCDEYGIPNSMYSCIKELSTTKEEYFDTHTAVRCRATRPDFVAVLNELKSTIDSSALELKVFRN